MKVVYQTIFDQLDEAIKEANRLDKVITKFVLSKEEFAEMWPSEVAPSETYYALIPVEVAK